MLDPLCDLGHANDYESRWDPILDLSLSSEAPPSSPNIRTWTINRVFTQHLQDLLKNQTGERL